MSEWPATIVCQACGEHSTAPRGLLTTMLDHHRVEVHGGGTVVFSLTFAESRINQEEEGDATTP